jgi:predicted RNase H-like HicB family nuclease
MEEIATRKIFEFNTTDGFLIEIHKDENELFYAMNSEEPYYCFEGKTIQEVVKTAANVIKSYKENFVES